MMFASLALILCSMFTTAGPVPCPGQDSAGYVLTETYADGSFRCELPAVSAGVSA